MTTPADTSNSDQDPKNLGIILGVLLVVLPFLVGSVLFVYHCDRRFVVAGSSGLSDSEPSLLSPLGFRRSGRKLSSFRDPMISVRLHGMAIRDRSDSDDRSALMDRNILPPREEDENEEPRDAEHGFFT